MEQSAFFNVLVGPDGGQHAILRGIKTTEAEDEEEDEKDFKGGKETVLCFKR